MDGVTQLTGLFHVLFTGFSTIYIIKKITKREKLENCHLSSVISVFLFCIVGSNGLMDIFLRRSKKKTTKTIIGNDLHFIFK